MFTGSCPSLDDYDQCNPNVIGLYQSAPVDTFHGMSIIHAGYYQGYWSNDYFYSTEDIYE